MAWLFLTHPGPSLLVTVVTVAAEALLARRLPDGSTAVLLVLTMLPAQMSIGALNDWADSAADAAAKPFKPIARSVVTRGQALSFAVVAAAVSMTSAALLGRGALLVDLLGLGAGFGYDLVLKRTPAAVIAWWAGFTALPLLAMVVAGRAGADGAAIPLAGLLAVALLLANGLPDAEADRLSGAQTLASILGERLSRRLMALCLLAAAALMLLLANLLHQGRVGVGLASASLAAAAGVALLRGRLGPLVFPVSAVCVAAAAVSWLAALPAAAG